MTQLETGEMRRSHGRLNLSVECDETGGAAILHCSGRISFRREAELLALSAQECLQKGCDLVLDLGGIEAVDSAGVGQLVLIHMQAEAMDCGVCIACAPEPVRNLLQLTNVASLFDFFDSVDDAVSSCSREVA